MVTLIDSTVSVTIRHSDSAPNASEAATARVNRCEATGAERLTKPAAPGDRIMAEFLQGAGESPATTQNLKGTAGNIGAGMPRKWQNGGKAGGYARYSSRYARYSRRLTPRRRCRRDPRLRHRASSPLRQKPGAA